jgi:hypothetical protein
MTTPTRNEFDNFPAGLIPLSCYVVLLRPASVDNDFDRGAKTGLPARWIEEHRHGHFPFVDD